MDHHRTLLAAQGYCELHMFQEALTELNSIPAAGQHEPLVVEMRLVALMQARHWREATEAARELCDLRPESNAPFIHLAFCLHELGDTAEAKSVLLKGPETLLKESNYYYNLACYECVLGNLTDAQRLLNASFRLDEKYKEFAKTDPDLRALREASK